MQVVDVRLPDGRSYEVFVGAGATERLLDVLAAVVPAARRAAIVTQQAILGANEAVRDLDTGLDQRVFAVGPGEGDKSLATIERLCRDFAQWGLNRNDVVIGVGGGMVTDIAGFAASCYHRGVATVYVSTTLLGMVDAAIGGKTGVNLPEGKNLVGAYWQPAAVFCDLDLLASMPERERRCGLGEMAKYHFLDPSAEPFEGSLEDKVARSVAIKAKVVAADEREGGVRAILNYGHTLGHAIESLSEYSVMHGEAVAIGLVYAAELAHALGRIDAGAVARHRDVVRSYGLDTTIPHWLFASDDDFVTQMRRDKKALDGITFVLDGPDGVEVVAGVDPDVVRSTIAKVR